MLMVTMSASSSVAIVCHILTNHKVTACEQLQASSRFVLAVAALSCSCLDTCLSTSLDEYKYSVAVSPKPMTHELMCYCALFLVKLLLFIKATLSHECAGVVPLSLVGCAWEASQNSPMLFCRRPCLLHESPSLLKSCWHRHPGL